MQSGSIIIPCIRYENAKSAMEWLEKNFGFATRVCYEGEDGLVHHAQMTFGTGMIMVGSTGVASSYTRQLKQPSEIGGFQTQSPYVILEDVRAHYERATAGGVEIVLPLEDVDGRLGYTCKDIEGHLWSFGNYDPWK